MRRLSHIDKRPTGRCPPFSPLPRAFPHRKLSKDIEANTDHDRVARRSEPGRTMMTTAKRWCLSVNDLERRENISLILMQDTTLALHRAIDDEAMSTCPTNMLKVYAGGPGRAGKARSRLRTGSSDQTCRSQPKGRSLGERSSRYQLSGMLTVARPEITCVPDEPRPS